MKVLLLLILLCLVGCKTPQLRVFQSKVPAPLVKSGGQVEAERRAALFVAEKSPDGPVKEVAKALSESLGPPEDTAFISDIIEAAKKLIAKIRHFIAIYNESIADLNERLAKYDGKKIEGTGVNLFGFAVSLPVLGLIALAIFCPSSIGVMWWLLKKARAAGGLAEEALVRTIKGVQGIKSDFPDISNAINQKLDGYQDEAHKALIRKLKTKLPTP